MQPDAGLDPAALKQAAGRKATSTADDLLALLNDGPLTTAEWKQSADDELGVSKTKFYRQLSELTGKSKAIKTTGDKWKKA